MDKKDKKQVKIKLMSDLHMEFKSPEPAYYSDFGDKYDLFIIAGDISNCNSPALLKELATLIKPKYLLYVTGNHDYYRSSREFVDIELENLHNEIKNFIFLNHKIVNIMNINFIGCTGWQNVQDFNHEIYPINDFDMIEDHAKNIVQWGKDDYSFLNNSLKSLQKKPVVVVTHIPPSSFALNLETKDFQEYPILINAYSNTYDDLIKQYKPVLWCCGHAHDSFNDVLHKTRIVRNAYGYHNMNYRRNKKFEKHKIINLNFK